MMPGWSQADKHRPYRHNLQAGGWRGWNVKLEGGRRGLADTMGIAHPQGNAGAGCKPVRLTMPCILPDVVREQQSEAFFCTNIMRAVNKLIAFLNRLNRLNRRGLS